jgi:hypothetical protein
MKLVTFEGRTGARVGALTGSEIVDLTEVGVARSMRSLIENGASALANARAALASGARLPLDSVRLLAPVPEP